MFLRHRPRLCRRHVSFKDQQEKWSVSQNIHLIISKIEQQLKAPGELPEGMVVQTPEEIFGIVLYACISMGEGYIRPEDNEGLFQWTSCTKQHSARKCSCEYSQEFEEAHGCVFEKEGSRKRRRAGST